MILNTDDAVTENLEDALQNWAGIVGDSLEPDATSLHILQDILMKNREETPSPASRDLLCSIAAVLANKTSEKATARTLGMIYYVLSDLKLSRHWYEECYRCDTSDGRSLRDYLLLLIENEEISLAMKMFSEASSEFRRGQSSYQIASELLNRAHAEEAIVVYSDLWKLRGEAHALVNVGIAEEHQGHLSRAMEAYREALQYDLLPLTRAYTLHLLARLEAHAGDRSGAIMHYEMAITYEGVPPEVEMELAWLLYDQDEAEKARFHFATVYNKTRSAESLLGCAYCLRILGVYANALSLMECHHKTQEPSSESLECVGYCLSELGRAEEAVAILEKAAALDDGNMAARQSLADSLVATEQFQRALRLYESLIEDEPLNPRHHIGVGECYRELEEYEQSSRAFAKALELAPDDGNLIALLAMSRLSAGDTSAFFSYLEKLKVLDPNHYVVLLDHYHEYQEEYEET